jgi:hypothetical protein
MIQRVDLEIPAAPEPGRSSFSQRASSALAALRGRVPNVGRTVVHFGAFPGAADARVDVTDQKGIVESSIVQAWIAPIDTPDHSADEHMVEPLRVVAGNIVPGVGFTTYAFYAGFGDGLAYGQFTVAWSWV